MSEAIFVSDCHGNAVPSFISIAWFASLRSEDVVIGKSA